MEAMDQVELSIEQKQVIGAVLGWLKEGREPYITVGGFAGTGKTTLVGILRKLIYKADQKAKVALCAYTGKASRVLEAAIKHSDAGHEQDSVGTIHSLIYSPIVTGGRVIGWRRKERIAADLIVVDEASMVDADIWQDLLTYQIPIVAVGDHGQLPPIGGKFNLMDRPKLTLNTIHRQAIGNPIIELSMMARQEGRIPIGNYGRGVRKLDRYDSASGQEVEALLQTVDSSLLILTGFNWTRVKLNQTIREFKEIEGSAPRVGDRVICLKNNWEKGIYNGMLGQIKRLIPVEEKQVIRFFEAEVAMDDDLTYTGLVNALQFGQSTTLNEAIFKNKEKVDRFDFGYALTVHKAQGSQAPRVLLFEERSQHMDDEMWRRWLYTGVTRAQEELTIVGT